MSREDGFTLVELLVSITIMLLVTGAALTTFKNGLTINDSAAQLGDANQNLRAGTNQLIRDLMQAGRIIGPEGIPLPTGAGVQAFARPGPTGERIDVRPRRRRRHHAEPAEHHHRLPARADDQRVAHRHGHHHDGRRVHAGRFRRRRRSPATPTPVEGTIAADGQSVTLPATSLWLVGDTDQRHAADPGRRPRAVQEPERHGAC